MTQYYLSEDEIGEIKNESIRHISNKIFNNAIARLEKNPEHYDLSDEEKKIRSFNIVKDSLKESYGENLRTSLIEISDLRGEVLGDESNIIITDEDPSDETDGIEG
ncbi:hypothetical protein [Salinibacter ruber]|uniref:hypothetical protein n=1 Tax=Salinibacter ruber TaxID=146919 RepID=UPI00216901DC|nr:hypothetical protein [Salinibacter ruber]MCS4149277.1 hypothetical protein [Salinibacter ruber]